MCSTDNPTKTVDKNTHPKNAPITVPAPPRMSQPPTTTAAMLISSNPKPAVAGFTNPNFEAYINPANPASAPQIAYAPMTVAKTGTARNRAASELEPMAKSRSPHTVRCASTNTKAKNASAMIRSQGTDN